jgi:hypothetical protein
LKVVTAAATVEIRHDQGERGTLSSSYIPSRGERVAQVRCGIQRIGTVWYSDQLQVLVRWDEGTSSSLRLGSEELYVLNRAEPHAVTDPKAA